MTWKVELRLYMLAHVLLLATILGKVW